MAAHATVLVVDDDGEWVEVMREILEAEGHHVLVARNGRQALEITKETRPDLVLLDLEMPEMDGRAFLAELHSDPRIREVTVVVLSGAEDCDRVSSESVRKPLRL